MTEEGNTESTKREGKNTKKVVFDEFWKARN